MSGYYPDGVNQAIFDRYWDQCLDDEDDEPTERDDYWTGVDREYAEFKDTTSSDYFVMDDVSTL